MILNVWLYIALLLAIVVIGVVINEIESNKYKKETKMSFMESLDLTGLPIVTFSNNGHKFNFLLDSGANVSTINSIVLEKFVYTKSNEVGTVFGIEGKKVEINFVRIGLDYKEKHFLQNFQILNLESAFNHIKEESGVTVSGILGSDFFTANKYVLDFDELIAYSKK